MLPISFTPAFLAQLELLRLRARRSFLGSRQGQHLSLRRGHGIEFSDHREYQPGDSPRSIDWGVFARTDKLYVKRSHEDENLSLLIALDCSASMGIAEDQSKWKRACELALALAYVGLMEQDSIIFAPLGAGASMRFDGARAFGQLANKLSQIKPQGKPELGNHLREAISKLASPGIAVFISDFFIDVSELDNLFLPLRAANLEISALQVIGLRDREPVPVGENIVAIDSETLRSVELSFDEPALKKYQANLQNHIEHLQEYFSGARVSFTSSDSKDSLIELFTKVLPRLGLLQ